MFDEITIIEGVAHDIDTAHVNALLTEALTDRIQSVKVTFEDEKLILGFVTEPNQVLKLIEYGPKAEDEEAAARFRYIWGEKAELRRFKDGRILESVVWEVPQGSGLDTRAQVFEQVVKYLCELHIDFKGSLQHYGNQFFKLLKPHPALQSCRLFKQQVFAFQPVMQASNNFIKKLKDMEDLPLSLVDVRMAHPSLRYTSVLLPQPVQLSVWQSFVSNSCQVKPYVQPMDLVLIFEHSSQWPDTLYALQKMKALFLTLLGRRLNDDGSIAQLAQVVSGNDGITDDGSGYLDVLSTEGFAYRLRIKHEQELVMMERLLQLPSTSDQDKGQLELGVKLHKDRFINEPMFNLYVSSLVHKFPALSHSIRMFKRWLAQHFMLSEGAVSEQVAELLVICAFLSSRNPPSSAMHGLIVTFQLLQHNFADTPLIVHLTDDVPPIDLNTKVQALFDQAMINNSGPVIYLSVSVDSKNGFGEDIGGFADSWLSSYWTEGILSKESLQNLQKLAKSAINHYHKCVEINQSSQLLSLFVSQPMKFDITITLDPKLCARYYQSVQCQPKKIRFKELYRSVASGTISGPIFDYDPAASFVQILSSMYGCNVYYDKFDMSKICLNMQQKKVISKNTYLETMLVPVVKEVESKVQIDLQSFVDQIKQLGEGIILSVTGL